MLVQPDACHILVVTRSTVDFVGEYTCKATNSEGTAKTHGKLEIKSLSFDQGDGDESSEEISCSDDENEFQGKEPLTIQRESVDDYYTLLEELGKYV